MLMSAVRTSGTSAGAEVESATARGIAGVTSRASQKLWTLHTPKGCQTGVYSQEGGGIRRGRAPSRLAAPLTRTRRAQRGASGTLQMRFIGALYRSSGPRVRFTFCSLTHSPKHQRAPPNPLTCDKSKKVISQVKLCVWRERFRSHHIAAVHGGEAGGGEVVAVSEVACVAEILEKYCQSTGGPTTALSS